LIQIILSLGILECIRTFAKNRLILPIIVSIICIFIFFECKNTTKNNYFYFNRTGGTGNNSDRIYALTKYLVDTKIEEPIIMDWGIYHNLIFLSQGKIIPRTFNYVEGNFDKQEFIKDLKNIMLGSNLYLFHSPEFTNRSNIYPIFFEISKKLGKTIRTEKIFYQRDGRPVYVIYSLR
jgi:hypothetical protein